MAIADFQNHTEACLHLPASSFLFQRLPIKWHLMHLESVRKPFSLSSKLLSVSQLEPVSV